MHVFYTPDIQSQAELPEEEAAHAVRVLRLQTGDEVTLTERQLLPCGNQYRHDQALPCQHTRNHPPSAFMERTPAHCNGSHQEYGPHGMVCRESHRNRL